MLQYPISMNFSSFFPKQSSINNDDENSELFAQVTGFRLIIVSKVLDL